MPKKIFYKGFDADLIKTAAEFLCSLSSGTPIVDLADCIAVLPGKNMIRTLNCELAKAEHGIFPPLMLTPATLLRFGLDHGVRKTASDMEQLQIWQNVLKAADPAQYQNLFNGVFPQQDPALLYSVASDLLALRKELSRNAHTISSAGAFLKEEYGRWDALDVLEKEFLRQLEEHNLTDPTAEIVSAVDDVSVFRKYKKLVLISTPDLPPVLIRRLKNVLAQTEIEINILIAAPDPETLESKEHLFDEWGQVIPEMWKNYSLPIRETHHHLHAVNNPAAAAELAVVLARNHGIFDTEQTCAAIADPAVFPDFEKAFSRFRKEDSGAGLDIYDPAGIAMKKLRILPVLECLAALGKNSSPETVRLFLRNQDLARFCVKNTGFSSEDQLLAASDQYLLAKLPDMIHPGLPDPGKDRYQSSPEELKKLFALLGELQELFSGKKENGVTQLRELLKNIFPAENYPPIRAVAFASEETEVRNTLSAMEKSTLFKDLDCAEVLDILIRTLREHACYPEHTADAMEICGFLDLPFRNAQHIILCGVNDGLIPEKTSQNPYLTDTRRKALGLPDNDSRFARDCFYLTTLLEKTACDDKSLHLISWKFNKDGSNSRFSPILFKCSDAELLQRIHRLYDEQEEIPSFSLQNHGNNSITLQPDFSRAFLKKDPDGNDALILSVTDFKLLLASPLRAFLSRSLGMNKIDYDRLDLDHAGFGTDCHKIFENIKNPFDTDCRQLQETLKKILYAYMKKTYGDPLPMLIGIQQEILEKRLYHAAIAIADDSKGFECIETEWKLGGRQQNGIPFEGAVIRGTIDRIEVSRDRKTLRLIDFKTFSRKETPAKKHLHTNRQGCQTFIDLQLPLYKLLLPLDETFREAHPELDLEHINIICGYFCLPTAVTETGYALWNDLSDDIMESAKSQTCRFINAIKIMQERNFCIDDFTSVAYDDFKNILLPDKELAMPDILFHQDSLTSI